MGRCELWDPNLEWENQRAFEGILVRKAGEKVLRNVKDIINQLRPLSQVRVVIFNVDGLWFPTMSAAFVLCVCLGKRVKYT